MYVSVRGSFSGEFEFEPPPTYMLAVADISDKVTSRNVDGAGKLEQNNLYYIRKRYCLQNKLIQFTVFEMLFFFNS